MAGFIEGVDRAQSVLFPDRLDDWIGEDSLVRVVDLFVDEIDLPRLGFTRSAPARIRAAKSARDVARHYSRPDVFDRRANGLRQRHFRS